MGEYSSADEQMHIQCLKDSDIPEQEAIKNMLKKKVQQKFHELKRDMTSSNSQVIIGETSPMRTQGVLWGQDYHGH